MSIILNVINYFWKLGFIERTTDVYEKAYTRDTTFLLNLADKTFDYGPEIEVLDPALLRFSQKNFVIMESLDRLFRRGVSPASICLRGDQHCDYTIAAANRSDRIAVACRIWEHEYDDTVETLDTHDAPPRVLGAGDRRIGALVIYTSRLKAGIIEHRTKTFARTKWLPDGAAVSSADPPDLFGREMPGTVRRSHQPSSTTDSSEFEIRNSVLVAYRGSAPTVVIPQGVRRLGNGVFWNNVTVERIELPEGLRSLGGDTFYNCPRLAMITIPESVDVMGDNPFAACPELVIANRSPHFRLDEDLLTNASGTRVIHCNIKGESTELEVPEGTVSVGKHSFYNCQRLRRIVLPPSLRIIENNPFSNLPNLHIENRSSEFILRDGALYNQTMGTLFYYQHDSGSDSLEIPNGVRIIGRHSFYNCKSIRVLRIPPSVTIIGYNPFAGCSSLRIESQSPAYVQHDGVLCDQSMTELIYYPISSSELEFVVPDGVRKIGRSAFFMGTNLERVTLPSSLETIERSAFAGCSRLSEVNVPAGVAAINDWAFSDCPSLQRVRIPIEATVATQAFSGSPTRVDLVHQ